MVKCPPPCGQSDSEANASTAGESKEEAAADEQSEGEAGTDSPSEGESSGSSESSAPSESESTDSEGTGEKEPDFSEIERPTQSDTVETLPGSAKDNEDHIKGEDKADSTETPSEPAAPSESEDKDSTETPAESKTPAESPASSEPETKPEEPAKDDLDYSVVVDEKTGHFKITFNIKEDAEGDQTLELSKVLETVNANGQKEFEKWFQTKDGYNALDDAKYYGESTIRHKFDNGIEYIYDVETGTARLYAEPGCTTIFDISLSNGSKHTYVYKDNSFTVSTPDVSNKDKTGVTGFDGQELPEEYSKGYFSPKYSEDSDINGVLENIIDEALKDTRSSWQYGIDKDGNLTTSHSQKLTSKDIPVGTPVYKIGKYYYLYSEANDCYYAEFNSAQVKEEPQDSGNYVVKSVPSSGKTNYAFKYDSATDTKTAYNSPYVRGSDVNAIKASPRKIQDALNQYLKKNDTTLADEILKYYNGQLGSGEEPYTSIEELLEKNSDAVKELTREGSESSQDQTLDPILVRSSSQYDNFYNNIFSFKVGDPKDVEGDATGNIDHGHSHGQWATDSDGAETIGQYMADELNRTGKWAEANAYFNQLLKSGMSEDEATWAAFTMATNIDGPRADNNYQNTAWSWYASMVLKQVDGTLDLTKTDKDTGEVIKDSETSFYLWKYETEVDEKTHEETKSTLYYTYVDATTDKDGNEVPGYYGWVKYDPDNNQMTYTITTTNGKLNIDYELLENMVYYLQEAVAPEGYDIDTTVYIICDEEDYEQAVSDYESYGNSAGKDAGVTSDSTSWLGTIEGGKTLKIEFVNSKTVTPDPTPDPEPDPDPVPDPENPDTPVDPANPENPPVQDATPEEPAPETPVTPDTPQNPPVQDAAPDAPVLPKTGTSAWLVHVLLAAGFLLTAGGWFFTRKQSNCKH